MRPLLITSNKPVILGAYGGAHLGDALCISPLIRQLHVEANAQVYVSRHPAAETALANNPHLAGYFDGNGFALRTLLRGRGHLIQRLQRGAGVAIDSVPKPEIYLSKEETIWALEQRASWPVGKPFCVFSTGVIADGANYVNTDWLMLAEVLSDRFNVIQPRITKPLSYIQGDASASKSNVEPKISGAIPYENLTTRQYLSLFSVVDAYCGGISGGSHAAAAFDLPAVTVIWRMLKNKLVFPVPEHYKTTTAAHFLYPYHHFIAVEDISTRRFQQPIAERVVRAMARECDDSVYREQRRFVSAQMNSLVARVRRVPIQSNGRMVFVAK